MWKLFLDDLRQPSYAGITPRQMRSVKIARSSSEAIALIERKGAPKHIYFDHDLGGDDNAMILVNWLIEKDLDCDFLPSDFSFSVHSDNPPGRANIEGKLGQYLRFKEG